MVREKRARERRLEVGEKGEGRRRGLRVGGRREEGIERVSERVSEGRTGGRTDGRTDGGREERREGGTEGGRWRKMRGFAPAFALALAFILPKI